MLIELSSDPDSEFFRISETSEWSTDSIQSTLGCSCAFYQTLRAVFPADRSVSWGLTRSSTHFVMHVWIWTLWPCPASACCKDSHFQEHLPSEKSARNELQSEVTMHRLISTISSAHCISWLKKMLMSLSKNNSQKSVYLLLLLFYFFLFILFLTVREREGEEKKPRCFKNK